MMVNVLMHQFRLRANLYGLFSRGMLLELSAADLVLLDGVLTMVSRLAESAGVSSFAPIVADMRQHPGLAVRDADGIERLACEFSRIFLVGAEAAAPYASVYCSPESLAMQEQRDESLAFYARHGLGRRSSCVEPEDHLGIQLEFLVALNRQAEAGEEAVSCSIDAQAQFLAACVTGWLPKLVDRIRGIDEGSWYLAYVRLIAAFVNLDERVWLPALRLTVECEPSEIAALDGREARWLDAALASVH
jgi:TorA maturation chaperone TorD